MAHSAKSNRASLWTILWICPLLLALGCVKGSTPETEQNSGAHAEELIGPFSITLTVPNPLSPLAPVLEGTNSIFFGAGSEVATGTTVSMGTATGAIHTEPDVFLNETWSRGNI